jgi:ATP-dependent Clp protease ATP-binding subunit ClpA
VLDSLDITVEEVRAQVARIVGQGDEVTTGQIPFTPSAKNALDQALREALSLGHDYIGTEHILLGLVRRENESVAVRILLNFDADTEKIRNEIVRMLSPQVAVVENPRARRAQVLKAQTEETARLLVVCCPACGRTIEAIETHLAPKTFEAHVEGTRTCGGCKSIWTLRYDAWLTRG